MLNSKKFYQLAKEVLEIEAEAVLALCSRIDDKFLKACEYLLACEGRIVVTGMGKSSHVASKIAATLSSTGSPAFFVHPGEASHGDIGVLGPKDVVLAISYSGNTQEILAILPAIKRLQLPLIALTGSPNSTLAHEATVHIDVSVAKEACPIGLAPTASTTAALAMGDALAVTLIEARGFTAEDFALSHPGGILGKKLLLQVGDLMHTGKEIPMISDESTLNEALLEMTRKHLGMTLVVDLKDAPVGVFTDGDLRRVFEKSCDLREIKIQNVMIKKYKTIRENALALDALRLMEKHAITSLVVLKQDGNLAGVVHMHDILRAGLS